MLHVWECWNAIQWKNGTLITLHMIFISLSVIKSTLSSNKTGLTPKKGLVGYSGLTGESSGAGLGDKRIPPVSKHSGRKKTILCISNEIMCF